MNKWGYICTLINPYNKEIIGYAVATNKDAKLIGVALLRYNYILKDIQIFY